MSNKQETIADIVAEMRKFGELDEESTDKIPRRLMGLGLRTYADRLESAAKREECELLAQIAELRQKIDDGKFFTPKAARDAIAGERPLDEMLKAPLPTGNAAAMREALEVFVEYSELVCRMGMFNRDRLVAITTKARKALTAPLRNCDILGWREAWDKWRSEKHPQKPVSYSEYYEGTTRFMDWYMGTAEDRGTTLRGEEGGAE